MVKVRLYRYHPEQDELPRMETLEVEEGFRKAMVLDVLEHLKQQDATLAYRRSCREGVCGSDGMNINGKNGPAGLIQAYRFLIDSRDTATEERLAELDDPFSVFRCRQIANCTWVCPKGLNPMRAIGHIKVMLLTRGS
ncbi:MAG: hypothetical protein LC652_06590 [Halomonas sp.]|nr:hypothetical protein [Halomonas sp.]